MPNRTGRHYKSTPPIFEGEEWRCPKCERCFPSELGCWGHIGRAHNKNKEPFTHGVKSGYLTHRRRHEKACPGCLAAWRTYYRLRKQEKNA